MKRHMYKLTHQNIVPGRIGQIIPVLRQEVCPGDSFQGRIGILCRFKGFAAPVLTPTYLDFYMFYVPNRLAWTGWEDFITGQDIAAGQDSSDNAVSGNFAMPTAYHSDAFLSNNTGPTNSLYARGYNLIYNNYFKDEDDADTPVTNVNYLNAYHLRNQYNELRNDTSTFDTYAPVTTDPDGLTGDYVGAQDVRDAMRRQRFAERREMFGNRYFDLLRSYGVRTNYNMLERPESLGKSRHVVSFTDIPATADTDGGSTVGDLAGHGIVGLHHRMPRKTFSEHGYLHGVIVVRPSQFVNSSSPTDAFKSSPSDYWAPEFEMETAQAVTTRQVKSAGGDTAIGYVPKFQEYRKSNNFIQKTYNGEDTWGNEWTFEQNIPDSAGYDDARNALRKVVDTDYDDAFNSTSATEPHFRALVHNGLTAYRLVGPQQKI